MSDNPQPCIIEPANIDDVHDIADLHSRMFDDGWTVEDFCQFISSKIDIVLKARNSEGDLCGFLVLRIVVDEAEILTVGVASDCRRQGIGDLLCKAAVDISYEHMVKKMHLEVRENNFSALSLYEKAGFKISGKRKDYYRSQEGQNRVHAFIMQYLL